MTGTLKVKIKGQNGLFWELITFIKLNDEKKKHTNKVIQNLIILSYLIYSWFEDVSWADPHNLNHLKNWLTNLFFLFLSQLKHLLWYISHNSIMYHIKVEIIMKSKWNLQKSSFQCLKNYKSRISFHRKYEFEINKNR